MTPHDTTLPASAAFTDVLVESPSPQEPPERLVGGVDDTGEGRPMCRPESHEDGKHSVLCLAGVLGYRQAADGLWDPIPPDPLSIAGAVWRFEGEVYVRPVGRGVSLPDGARYPYLEDLPTGDYRLSVTFERIETTDA